MRILILTCNTGGGHNSTAAALTERFHALGAACDVMDGLSFISQKASRFVSRWHTRLYRRYPKLYKSGYQSAERDEDSHRRDTPVYRYLARGARRLDRTLKAGGYDAVVCVHVIPALMMTEVRRLRPDAPVFCFVATDYTCSPTVGACKADICVIPHEDLRQEFVSCGVAPETILPAGIPVRAVFRQRDDRAAARSALALPPEGRHIVLMSGSIGCGPMTELAAELELRLEKGDFASILCGSNRKLLHSLRMMGLRRVEAVGFTTRVPQYMDSADVLVSKPGGISITEAGTRGVPLLLADMVGGCETRNQSFFADHGWAATCDTEDIANAALELLRQPEKLSSLRAAQTADFDGLAAQRVAESVVSAVEQRQNL